MPVGVSVWNENILSSSKKTAEKENEQERKKREVFYNFSSGCKTFLQMACVGALLAGIGLAVVLTLYLSQQSYNDTVNNTSTGVSTTSISFSAVTTATTSSSTSSSTSITSSTTSVTITTTAATVTITSNTCTSGWQGVTILYHCHNNCTGHSSYLQYTYSYVAIANTTRITFVFRDDSDYFALDNITIWDNAAPSTQLISNGDFETGNISSWAYCNPNVASNAGEVQFGSTAYNGYTYTPYSGMYFYMDGSVGAPDYLSQTFATTIGSTYNISYWLYNGAGGTGVSVDVIMSV
ncbi:unnamed protein product [Rotaria socialis]|uniref:Uncharacterized protein n=2 Tax=Rotaria socialis TaxID=392032 RepID=A0A817SYI8_9BILA|nr:unnamed protein product [Rotaria socialis]